MSWRAVIPSVLKAWPAPMGLTVTGVGFTDRGGCDEAELEALGDVETLAQLFGLIGSEIKLYNETGMLTWYGILYAVEVGSTAASFGSSLDKMINRVAVSYTQASPDGGQEAYLTAWTQEDASVSRFGAKERIVSLGEGSASMAAARATQVLARRGWPRPRRGSGIGSVTGWEAKARLLCLGYYRFTDWRIYQNLSGRIENTDGSGSLTVPVGWQLTSTEIGFKRRKIHDMQGRLTVLVVGDKVTISGSALNNGNKTIEAGAETDLSRSYTATTIRFEVSDDIIDSAGGFAFARAGNLIHVSGSAANSGYHYINGVEDDGQHIVTDTVITNEAAGPSITVRHSSGVTIAETTTDENPGASVTVTQWGVKMAQKFVAPASLSPARLAVRIGKKGSPADSFLVELCADSAGAPGGVIATATFAPADLATDRAADVWGDLAAGVTSGVTYWLVFRRAGSADPANYFLLGLLEQNFWTTLAWNGSAWVDMTTYRTPEAGSAATAYSIFFRLHDAEDTSLGITRIVGATGGLYVSGVTVAATGVYRTQWADDQATGREELDRLLDAGTSAGKRLIANVSPMRHLHIDPEPDKGAEYEMPLWGADGVLYDRAGLPWPSGLNPTGQWVRIGGAPKVEGAGWQVSPDYVRAAWYDVEREKWRIQFIDESDEALGL